MIGLLQRVTEAKVLIGSREAARIGQGLLVLVGVQHADAAAQADRLLERLLGYRVFPDTQGRMNRSLSAVGGGLLLVPQFTLAADTARGMRASFTTAAEPARAQELFAYLLAAAQKAHAPVAAGVFGAHMQVHLVNDGPVTFLLEVR